eukprot:jgi/Mesvir1/3882/Mv25856-RA.1
MWMEQIVTSRNFCCCYGRKLGPLLPQPFRSSSLTFLGLRVVRTFWPVGTRPCDVAIVQYGGSVQSRRAAYFSSGPFILRVNLVDVRWSCGRGSMSARAYTLVGDHLCSSCPS